MKLISTIIFTSIIIIILLLINLILGEKYYNKEKIQPYECGIIPIGENREKINIQYIIIGILYIIFDIEIILLIPYSMTQNKKYTYWIVFLFIIIITFGYIFELNKNALNYKGKLT